MKEIDEDVGIELFHNVSTNWIDGLLDVGKKDKRGIDPEQFFKGYKVELQDSSGNPAGHLQNVTFSVIGYQK